MSFLVKLQSLKDGTLETINKFYESFEEAKAHIETVVADVIKIYDHDGQLVHSTEEKVVAEFKEVEKEIEEEITEIKSKTKKVSVDVPKEVKTTTETDEKS